MRLLYDCLGDSWAKWEDFISGPGVPDKAIGSTKKHMSGLSTPPPKKKVCYDFAMILRWFLYFSIENDMCLIDPIFSIENDISLTDIFHLQPARINKIGGALRAPPIFARPLVNEIYRSKKYHFRLKNIGSIKHISFLIFHLSKNLDFPDTFSVHGQETNLSFFFKPDSTSEIDVKSL